MAMNGVMSGMMESDLYGGTFDVSPGLFPQVSVTDPASVMASGMGAPARGDGPAYAFVGFVALLVFLRIAIELGGEVE